MGLDRSVVINERLGNGLGDIFDLEILLWRFVLWCLHVGGVAKGHATFESDSGSWLITHSERRPCVLVNK